MNIKNKNENNKNNSNNLIKIRKDLTNKKFHKLIVIKRANSDYIDPKGKHYAKWICQCDCGNTVEVLGTTLTSRNTKSCGCLLKETASRIGKNNFKDITGLKFGNLTALKCVGKSKNVNDNNCSYIWECQCNCKNKTIIKVDRFHIVL